MKNTYIPLDMVFIDGDGRIQQIVEQTTPHSLAIISSREPALAVLEIAGGEAKRLDCIRDNACSMRPSSDIILSTC